MNPEIKKRFDDYISQKGMRRTAQRDVIVEAAFSSDDHFTAEELFVKAKRIDPKTSRATLYRALKTKPTSTDSDTATTATSLFSESCL